MTKNSVSKLYKSSEELEKPELAQINGRVPKWLRGSFLRTGPGMFDLGKDYTFTSVLDGYAMLSKFTIDEDVVTFEKKYLQSNAFQRAMKAGYPVITEFASRKFPDPNKGFFSRMLSSILPIELSDNNQISLFQMGKDVLASSETCFFHKIVPDNLATGEKFDTNKCFGTNIACAHPLLDEAAGCMYNIGSSVLTGTKYNIIRIPLVNNVSAKDLLKKAEIICSIPSSWTSLMSYNHSFAMTEKYIILVEQPFVMDLKLAAVTYLKGDPNGFKEWLRWRPDLKNRFFIVEKATGKLIKTEFFSKDPFFFLHQINAYEENDQIVIDIEAYENPNVLDSMNLEKLRDGDLSLGSQASCHRYVIPVVQIKDVPEDVNLVAVKSDATAVRIENSIILTPEIITQPGLELPTISKQCCGKKYTYFYATGNGSETKYSNALAKVDMRKRETILWRENEFTHPGEPIFVPNPKGITEDDGVIISAVTDERENVSDFLLILDAKTFQELGRATFRAHIPLALHGLFIN